MYWHRWNVFSRVFIAGCLLVASNGSGQEKNLNRDLDPVVITGAACPEFAGAPVADLFLFAYTNGTWQMIPFQIDERDTLGSYFNADSEIGFDANDELVFMAKDAGGRADSVWIADVASQQFMRYEIAVRDTSNGEQTGWVYLYRSNTLTPQNQTDYVDYVAGPAGTAPADTVQGQSYRVANAANGLPNFLAHSSDGSSFGDDLVDKQQLEIVVSVLGLPVVLNETDNFVGKSVKTVDGNIRVIRELVSDITLLDNAVFSDLPIPVFYYGYSYAMLFGFEIPTTLTAGALEFTITRLKQSLNLTAAAAGMTLFSKNNSGVPVDGVPDTIDDSVTLFPDETTWVMVTGAQGAFVNLYRIPPLGDSQKLFYEDAAASNAYGNAGFVISGEDIEGDAPFGFVSVFPPTIPQGEETALGNQLAVQLDVQALGQSFGQVTSVVERGDGEMPEAFTLAQNFPNPFNPATVIRYTLPVGIEQSNQKNTTLRIYNLLGEHIITLVDKAQTPGTYSVTWDGRDRLGRHVPSGIYVYRLKAGPFTVSRKMIVVK